MRVLLFALLISPSATAQCYVNAGPDIDVCMEGTVQLHGTFEGNVSSVSWIGGKGTFEPNRQMLEAEYTPSADEAGTDVLITLVANAKNGCPSEMKDEIKLTVNTPVKAIAGKDMHLCMGDVQL